MRATLFAFGAVLLVISSIALSHEGATGVVKQRMDDMKLMGRSLKRITERLQSKRGVAEIVPDAEAIAAAAARVPSLFPPGSRDGHTEATAAVWSRWPEFVASSQALAEASDKLAAAARSGHEAAVVSEQFRAVTRTCSGCHDVFRVRK